MMIDREMTDAEVADQIARTDRFIAAFLELIAATAVDPSCAYADHQRRGLRQIRETVNAVDYGFFANLATSTQRCAAGCCR